MTTTIIESPLRGCSQQWRLPLPNLKLPEPSFWVFALEKRQFGEAWTLLFWPRTEYLGKAIRGSAPSFTQLERLTVAFANHTNLDNSFIPIADRRPDLTKRRIMLTRSCIVRTATHSGVQTLKGFNGRALMCILRVCPKGAQVRTGSVASTQLSRN
jgi:hypothetical protein